MGSEAATQFEQMQTKNVFFCKGFGTNAAMRYKSIHFIMQKEYIVNPIMTSIGLIAANKQY